MPKEILKRRKLLKSKTRNQTNPIEILKKPRLQNLGKLSHLPIYNLSVLDICNLYYNIFDSINLVYVKLLECYLNISVTK